jgi:hypothetical protein
VLARILTAVWAYDGVPDLADALTTWTASFEASWVVIWALAILPLFLRPFCLFLLYGTSGLNEEFMLLHHFVFIFFS